MTTTPTKFKVIYNDCYGGFRFSAAFEAEYKKRTGWDIMAEKRLFKLGPESVRRDPAAIALLEEKGAEWSSGDSSYLEIQEIPQLFEKYWYVQEYDGNETIHVEVHQAYADILHAFMADGDNAKLVEGYRRIRTAAGMLFKTVDLLTPAEVEGRRTDSTTTTTRADVGGGYGFFDSGDSIIDSAADGIGGDIDSIAHD